MTIEEILVQTGGLAMARRTRLVAMTLTGLTAKQQGTVSAGGTSAGGVGGMLGGLLGGGAGGRSTGLAGLASMLEMGGDGNPLDDLLRMAGRG